MFILKKRSPAGGIRASQGTFSSDFYIFFMQYLVIRYQSRHVCRYASELA